MAKEYEGILFSPDGEVRYDLATQSFKQINTIADGQGFKRDGVEYQSPLTGEKAFFNLDKTLASTNRKKIEELVNPKRFAFRTAIEYAIDHEEYEQAAKFRDWLISHESANALKRSIYRDGVKQNHIKGDRV